MIQVDVTRRVMRLFFNSPLLDSSDTFVGMYARGTSMYDAILEYVIHVKANKYVVVALLEKKTCCHMQQVMHSCRVTSGDAQLSCDFR